MSIKNMVNIENNLKAVQKSIQDYAGEFGRKEGSIDLLAVSKTKPVGDIRRAFAAGQRAFGENYLQESLAKMEQLRDLPISWHYIGALQTNKAKAIAQNFEWVHTVDRIKIAERLSHSRPQSMAPLQLCIQVNIDEELTKSGCSAEGALELAKAISMLPNIKLRGLMAIPKSKSGSYAFKRMAQLLKEINIALNLSLDTLSMGMSNDMAIAISEGATIVRVGTAIFGQREVELG